MNVYALLLFFHVLAVAVVAGAMGVANFGLHQLRWAEEPGRVGLWLGVLRRLSVLFPVGSLVLLATGAELARSTGRLTQGWVIAAAVGLVAIVVLGATVNAAWGKRVGVSLAGTKGGPLTEATRAALARPQIYVSVRLTAGIVVGNLFLMTMRPSGVVSAVVLVAAGLLGAASALPMIGAAPAASRGPAPAVEDSAD
jgi:hypothetical protein